MKKYIKVIYCLCFIIIILSLFIIYVRQGLFSSKNMKNVKYVKSDKEDNKVKYTNNEKEVAKLIGKWKFTKRIMYPKAYSKEAHRLCDKNFLGRTIEIRKDLFRAQTFEIKAPFYNVIEVNNPYELMSGAGYLRNSVLKQYIKGKRYNLLELLENEPSNKNYHMYKNFMDEHYQDNDIWTLLIIDDETMIFFEDGCFEVKKIN